MIPWCRGALAWRAAIQLAICLPSAADPAEEKAKTKRSFQCFFSLCRPTLGGDVRLVVLVGLALLS